jgi:hypothetical protein
VSALLYDGARQEPDHTEDCKRPARGKRCGETGFLNTP